MSTGFQSKQDPEYSTLAILLLREIVVKQAKTLSKLISPVGTNHRNCHQYWHWVLYMSGRLRHEHIWGKFLFSMNSPRLEFPDLNKSL